MGVALEIWKEGIFGIGCLAMGLMLSLGLVSKKLPFWLGLTGPVEPSRGGFGPWKKKNPFSKRTESEPQVLACKSGPGMQKPGPNSAHCHSYYEGECSKCTKSHYERTIEMISLFVFHYLSYFNLHILILSIINGYDKMKTL